MQPKAVTPMLLGLLLLQDDRDAAGRHVNEQTTLLMGYVHQLKHEVATLEQAQQDLQVICVLCQHV